MLYVCLFVCPSVCLAKSYERILMTFLGAMRRGPRNSPSDIGGDPDHDADPGIFLQRFYIQGGSKKSKLSYVGG